MRVIARRTLREFIQSRAGHKDHAALKAALDAWFDEVHKAKWANTADVKRLYATASIVAGDRIFLNLKGNDYRLVTSVDSMVTLPLKAGTKLWGFQRGRASPLRYFNWRRG